MRVTVGYALSIAMWLWLDMRNHPLTCRLLPSNCYLPLRADGVRVRGAAQKATAPISWCGPLALFIRCLLHSSPARSAFQKHLEYSSMARLPVMPVLLPCLPVAAACSPLLEHARCPAPRSTQRASHLVTTTCPAFPPIDRGTLLTQPNPPRLFVHCVWQRLKQGASHADHSALTKTLGRRQGCGCKGH